MILEEEPNKYSTSVRFGECMPKEVLPFRPEAVKSHTRSVGRLGEEMHGPGYASCSARHSTHPERWAWKHSNPMVFEFASKYISNTQAFTKFRPITPDRTRLALVALARAGPPQSQTR